MSNCMNPSNAKYNTFQNIDTLEFNVIKVLFQNEDLWKLIKYDSNDALSPLKPNLTIGEKRSLIWNGELTDDKVDSSKYRVFKQSSTDDSFGDRNTQLRVYIGEINPENIKMSTVDIFIEIITHSKLNGLIDTEKNRVSSLLKNVLGTLNGSDIEGIGKLYFNQEETRRNKARYALNNSKNYFGYLIVMSTKISTSGY